MVPSVSSPERPAPAGTSPSPLELLEQIETHWRNALSLVLEDDPVSAAREVERAGSLLSGASAPDGVDPRALGQLAERVQQLGALHEELLQRSRSARDRLAQALEETRRGGKALRAYEPADRGTRGVDRLF